MDSQLIKKYFRGECSPDEVQQVLEWFKNKKLDPTQEQELYQFWQESESEKAAFTPHSARILDSINNKIDRQENEFVKANKFKKERNNRSMQTGHRKWLMKVAASILLPIGFLWMLMGYFLAGDQAPVKFVTIETLPGSRRTIQLEDGSKIILNGGSKVSYQEHFSTHKREIMLSGEAFFEVAKDSLRPFIVKTGTIFTQALGTSFNIKYWLKENDISVALATGVVKIEKEATQGSSPIARLKPGQQLTYNKTSHGYKVRAFDPLEVLSWREGILYFKKANLEQVVEKLESLYGVKIELTGKIPGKEKEWHYTGTYANQSLNNVLEGIAFVKKFSYETKGNTVKIKFN